VHCKYPPYKALGKFPKALYGGYLQCTHFPSCHALQVGNYLLSPFQQEKSLIGKMLYTNAARVPQEGGSDVWKNSFITLMFPREKPFDVAGMCDTYTN